MLFFFGPVAVLGTMLTQAGVVTWWAVVASLAVGLWAVAMLMINNIRDLEGDQLAGKRTLAVKLGDRRVRALFGLVVTVPLVLAVVIAFVHPWVLVTMLTAAPAVFIAVAMRLGPRGIALRPFFSGVSAVGFAFGLLLAIGLAL